MPTPAACVHCRSKKAGRPRGLCWTCYYTPGLREWYPICPDPAKRKYVRRGAPDFTGPSKPCRLTLTLPGTPERERVLTDRAQAGQSLFHPNDAQRDAA